jgi:hypothetical protein
VLLSVNRVPESVNGLHWRRIIDVRVGVHRVLRAVPVPRLCIAHTKPLLIVYFFDFLLIRASFCRVLLLFDRNLIYGFPLSIQTKVERIRRYNHLDLFLGYHFDGLLLEINARVLLGHHVPIELGVRSFLALHHHLSLRVLAR